jgi:hypothetical protein
MGKSQQMKHALVAAGINVTSVAVLGLWVHVDTFAKYESKLRSTMFAAGFQCVKVSDGIHMYGDSGFRMVFKVMGA